LKNLQLFKSVVIQFDPPTTNPPLSLRTADWIIPACNPTLMNYRLLAYPRPWFVRFVPYELVIISTLA
jgi:hypothetical protein